MLIHLVCLVSGFTALHAAAIFQKSDVTLNATTSLLAATDGTLGVNPPSPDFRVVPQFDSDLLPSDATLMGVLFFMSEMAYGDYYEAIESGVWSAPGYPDINIITWETVSAKYLIWGVFWGIEYMAKNNRFNAVQFTMKIKDEVVGHLRISLPPSSGTLTERSTLQLPPTQNNSDFLQTAATADLSSNTTSLGEDVLIGITTSTNAATLTKFDVFFVCYAALIHMAPIPPNFPLSDFTTRSPLAKFVYIEMLAWGPGVEVYRAIQVMLYVPRKMLTSRQGFREVNINLWLDGIRHLEADIHKVKV